MRDDTDIKYEKWVCKDAVLAASSEWPVVGGFSVSNVCRRLFYGSGYNKLVQHCRLCSQLGLPLGVFEIITGFSPGYKGKYSLIKLEVTEPVWLVLCWFHSGHK